MFVWPLKQPQSTFLSTLFFKCMLNNTLYCWSISTIQVPISAKHIIPYFIAVVLISQINTKLIWKNIQAAPIFELQTLGLQSFFLLTKLPCPQCFPSLLFKFEAFNCEYDFYYNLSFEMKAKVKILLAKVLECDSHL